MQNDLKVQGEKKFNKIFLCVHTLFIIIIIIINDKVYNIFIIIIINKFWVSLK